MEEIKKLLENVKKEQAEYDNNYYQLRDLLLNTICPLEEQIEQNKYITEEFKKGYKRALEELKNEIGKAHTRISGNLEALGRFELRLNTLID